MKSKRFLNIDRHDIIINDPALTLFVIGNGFDIAHGVHSNYYNFRDSLGRRSELRELLENYIIKNDLWADFENSLAYLNSEALISGVGDWMDTFDIPEEDDDDFSAADFFMTAETAAMPAQKIQQELPKKLRKWVETLQPVPGKKLLSDLLNTNCQYINFNYTEFLETIYGVPCYKILYIHGNRLNKKEELIIGHSPEAGPTEEEIMKNRSNRSRRRMTQTLYDLQETAGNHIAEYFITTTKDTEKIILRNKMFFESITDINTVIIIGHSLSAVDYPYFEKIKK